MEKAAEMPVTKPAKVMTLVSPRASVNPARAPVSSTKASFRPSTMDPTYCKRSSSSMPRRSFSWAASSSLNFFVSG